MVKLTILTILSILLCHYISPGLSTCNDPPAINNTESDIRVSPPVPEGSTISYSCLGGYEPYGNGIFTCLNGHWNGSFNCTIRECPSVDPPENGSMIFACRDVGCVIKVTCDVGHQIIGSNTLQCQLHGIWSHSVPECHIMKCPAPPFIEHAYFPKENSANGQSYVYDMKLMVKCDEQFIRSGPARIYCDSNGQWTPAPKCLPSTCPAYPDLDGKCVEKTKVEKLQNGALLLLLYCTENASFLKVNDGAAVCHNGKWDVTSMRCYCNCKLNLSSEGVLTTNFSSETLLQHGKTIDWSCKDGYTQTSAVPLTCYDGRIDVPKCVLHNSSSIENVSGRKRNKNQLELVLIIVGAFSILAIVSAVITLVCYKHRRNNRETHEGKDKTDQTLKSVEINSSKQFLQPNGKETKFQSADPDETERNLHPISEPVKEISRINTGHMDKELREIAQLEIKLAEKKAVNEKRKWYPNKKKIRSPLAKNRKKPTKSFQMKYHLWDPKNKHSTKTEAQITDNENTDFLHKTENATSQNSQKDGKVRRNVSYFNTIFK